MQIEKYLEEGYGKPRCVTGKYHYMIETGNERFSLVYFRRQKCWEVAWHEDHNYATRTFVSKKEALEWIEQTCK